MFGFLNETKKFHGIKVFDKTTSPILNRFKHLDETKFYQNKLNQRLFTS